MQQQLWYLRFPFLRNPLGYRSSHRKSWITVPFSLCGNSTVALPRLRKKNRSRPDILSLEREITFVFLKKILPVESFSHRSSISFKSLSKTFGTPYIDFISVAPSRMILALFFIELETYLSRYNFFIFPRLQLLSLCLRNLSTIPFKNVDAVVKFGIPLLPCYIVFF